MDAATPAQDKDALINAIGQRIVGDAVVNARPWNSYALIAWYGDGQCVISGFRYRDDGSHDAATPGDSPRLQTLFDQLRDATSVAGESAWHACVVRIVKATRKISVDFEYDDADAWHVQPGRLGDVVSRARPR